MLIDRASSAKNIKPALDIAITRLMAEMSDLEPKDLENFLETKLSEFRKA